LDKECDKLTHSTLLLESILGCGDYNPKNTKILHMTNNPAFEEKKRRQNAKLDALQEENNTLKAQLTILESGEGLQALNQYKLLDEQKNQSNALKELQQKLFECEKSRARYVEVFQKKFKEYKKAIKLLFGYRIQLYGESGDTYQLIPSLTSGKDNFLLFQYNRNNDSMSLCQTDYSSLWTKEFDYCLGQHGSYPAYIASITLALVTGK